MSQLTQKIYGPPGTGKTHYLLGKFEEELKHTKPGKIGFLTFTRAARLEALSRASLGEADLPYLKTIHAVCYSLMRVHHDNLVLTKDLKKFGKKIGAHLSGYMPDVFGMESLVEQFTQPTKADRLLQLNHLGRHRGLKLRETLRLAPLELDWQYAKWFTEAYRNWKEEEGLVDYTDLLTEYLERGPVPALDVLFVDEAQDLSWLQWKVIRKLGSNAERRYIAGDDDQAIFIWAGASATLFNTESADEVVVLPQSYRIARAIHEVAHRIIRRIKVRQEKEFRPREAPGVYRPVGNLDTSHLKNGETLVLYRNYHRGASLAAQLEELGVPFKGGLSTLGNPDIISTIQAWQKCVKGETVPVHQLRSLIGFASPRYLVEGIRKQADAKVGEFSPSAIFREEAFKTEWYHVIPKLPRIGYIDRIQHRQGWDALLNPTVQLMSIHQSKGREADTVVLDMDMARRTYEAYLENPEDEHRVYYVAVTRARDTLLTLLPTDPMSYQI